MTKSSIFRLFAAMGLLATALLFSGCITNEDGTKSFGPIRAAKKADAQIDDWIESQTATDFDSRRMPGSQ